MGTLGAKALLIGKSPWFAAPGSGWQRGREGGWGVLATSSLSEQPELKSLGCGTGFRLELQECRGGC